MTFQNTVFGDSRHMTPVRLLFVLCVMCAFRVPEAVAQSVEKNSIQARQKVEQLVARSGIGEKASVRVKLRDKSEVKGYVSGHGTDDFTVVDKQTNQPKIIPYNEVVKVKGNRSLAAKVAIGVGAGAAVVFGAMDIYALQGGFGG
jgi:hypothetical protein